MEAEEDYLEERVVPDNQNKIYSVKTFSHVKNLKAKKKIIKDREHNHRKQVSLVQVVGKITQHRILVANNFNNIRNNSL